MSQVEALRWAHIKTLMPLVRQYNESLNKEKDPRRRNQFPLNASEFRRMMDKEMQYKIAKILTQDIAGQDRLLQLYGWSFDKLRPVDDECASNVSPALVSAMHPKGSECYVASVQDRSSEYCSTMGGHTPCPIETLSC